MKSPVIRPCRRVLRKILIAGFILFLSGAWALSAVASSEASPPAAAPERGTREDVSLLIESLGHQSSKAREAAARSLGKRGDLRAVNPLVDALGDPHDDVRNAAADALKSLGEPLGEVIHTSLDGWGKAWEKRAWKAREELSKRKDPRTLPPLVRALGAWSINVRVAAAETLMILGDPGAVEPLIKAMSSTDKPVQAAAAWALFKVGDHRVFDPMIKALGDGYEPVRAAAAHTLGRFCDPRAVDPLVRALGDWDYSVREGAAYSLGNIGDARAVDPLIRSLRDKHEKVREAAAWSIGKMKDRRAFAPVVEALGDATPKVREASAWALLEMGDRRAVNPLISALGDDDPGVRKAAMQVLDKFGEPLGKRIYGALEGERAAMAELSGKKDPRSLAPLVRCLRSPDGKVRRAAAMTLGAIGDRGAVDGLVELAGGWNLSDRVTAMSSLLRIDQDVFPDLADAILRVALRPASLAYLLFIAGAAVMARYGPGWAGKVWKALSGWIR